MDILIAKTMLVQGYKERELVEALNLSESNHNQNEKNYGLNILHNVKKDLSKENEYAMGIGREIGRGSVK